MPEYDSFFPRHSGQIFILIGGPARPEPSNTFVTTTELPELWIQCIKSHEGDEGTAIEGQDELPDTPEKAETLAQSNDWRESARAIADECFDHDTNANPKVRDSLKGYSERVMEEMQNRKIHGPRGLIDNPKTIQREALQLSLIHISEPTRPY